MRYSFVILIALLSAFAAAAQMPFKVIPFYEQNMLETKEMDKSADAEITIESLRFYISDIKLMQRGRIVWAEDNSFHLMDLAFPRSFFFLLNVDKNTDFDGVQFNLGIDSVTNVSGIMDGDLDPTKGMYWAWQSGYVNFKLEGKCTKCPSKDKSFALHLGGYLPPNLALQKVILSIKEQRQITIKMDFNKFFPLVDFTKTHHIMSPCKEAVMLSEQAAQTFSEMPNEN